MDVPVPVVELGRRPVEALVDPQTSASSGIGVPSGWTGLVSWIVVGWTRHPWTWPQFPLSTEFTGSVATYESDEVICSTASTRRSAPPMLTMPPQNAFAFLEGDADTVDARHQTTGGLGQILEHVLLELGDPRAVGPHQRPHELVPDLGRSGATTPTCVRREGDVRHPTSSRHLRSPPGSGVVRTLRRIRHRGERSVRWVQQSEADPGASSVRRRRFRRIGDAMATERTPRGADAYQGLEFRQIVELAEAMDHQHRIALGVVPRARRLRAASSPGRGSCCCPGPPRCPSTPRCSSSSSRCGSSWCRCRPAASRSPPPPSRTRPPSRRPAGSRWGTSR